MQQRSFGEVQGFRRQEKVTRRERFREEVVALLSERGFILREGMIVDATLIATPPSTKNRQRKRDPERTSSKKGNDWHFSMKAHIGVDMVPMTTGFGENQSLFRVSLRPSVKPENSFHHEVRERYNLCHIK